MKKLFAFLLAFCCITSFQAANSQGLLKKVAKGVVNDVLGTTPDKSGPKTQPEPPSACADATLAVDLGGSLKLDYKEISISVRDDGALLLKDRTTSKYYVVKDGASSGPFEEGSAQVTGFEPVDNSENSIDYFVSRYRDIIKKQGDKYIITFSGKTYGPYAQISSFALTRNRDKFAALAIENIPASEIDGNKMEEAMKNAKTDQERMDLAMKYSQQMQQKMMQGGGPGSMLPKLVTNVTNATYDPLSGMGASLNGKIKYGEIVVVAYDKILDLQGKTLANLKQEAIGSDNIFLNGPGNLYAWYKYGTLSFSDGRTVAEMFNPYILSTGGSQWLAYMYYSPKKNALMQCKISF